MCLQGVHPSLTELCNPTASVCPQQVYLSQTTGCISNPSVCLHPSVHLSHPHNVPSLCSAEECKQVCWALRDFTRLFR